MFGEREEMIELARARIAEDPDSYSPKIYGLEEAGGTCVLVIGSHELMESAFDERIPDEALPETTWAVLSRIPTAVGVVGVGLVGLNWVLRRRMQLMSEVSVSQNGRHER